MNTLTTAQLIFSIALGVMTLIITAFAFYVVSTTMWGNRWVRAPRPSKTISTTTTEDA